MYVVGPKERKTYFKMSQSTKRFELFRIYIFMCMFPACDFRQRIYMTQGP